MSAIQQIFRYMIIICSIFFCHFSIHGTTTKSPQSKPVPIVPASDILIKMETTMGTVYIDLYKSKDPITVDHFLKYVDNGFYNGIIFHRIIEGFIIQAGLYEINFNPKLINVKNLQNQSKDNELKNTFGTIAIARKQNNPHTATAEFFINLAQNDSLDGNPDHFGYTVFGKVCQGMDVIQKISRIKIGERKGIQNAPVYPNEALIKEMTRVSNNPEKGK